MAKITVTPRGGGRFRVEVRDGDTTTEHEVTVSADELERLAGERTPAAFVRDCFAFLLEREPPASILREFDVSMIGRYFPEWEARIVDR